MDLIDYVNNWKADASRKNAAAYKGPWTTVGRYELSSPEVIADFQQKHLIYTGDGPRWMWSSVLKKLVGIGFPDTYTHPEIILGAIKNGISLDTLDIDCDDYACFSWYALERLAWGDKNLKPPKLLLLLAQSFQWISTPPFVYFPSHMVCVFERWDADLGRYRVGVMDNGLMWFDTLEEAVQFYNKLNSTTHKTRFVDYPFEVK